MIAPQFAEVPFGPAGPVSASSLRKFDHADAEDLSTFVKYFRLILAQHAKPAIAAMTVLL